MDAFQITIRPTYKNMKYIFSLIQYIIQCIHDLIYPTYPKAKSVQIRIVSAVDFDEGEG